MDRPLITRPEGRGGVVATEGIRGRCLQRASDKPAFGERHRLATSNDKVIEHPNINERQRRL